MAVKEGGHPENCTPEQKKVLAEIREYMKKYIHVRKQLWDDWFL